MPISSLKDIPLMDDLGKHITEQELSLDAALIKIQSIIDESTNVEISNLSDSFKDLKEKIQPHPPETGLYLILLLIVYLFQLLLKPFLNNDLASTDQTKTTIDQIHQFNERLLTIENDTNDTSAEEILTLMNRILAMISHDQPMRNQPNSNSSAFNTNMIDYPHNPHPIEIEEHSETINQLQLFQPKLTENTTPEATVDKRILLEKTCKHINDFFNALEMENINVPAHWEDQLSTHMDHLKVIVSAYENTAEWKKKYIAYKNIILKQMHPDRNQNDDKQAATVITQLLFKVVFSVFDNLFDQLNGCVDLEKEDYQTIFKEQFKQFEADLQEISKDQAQMRAFYREAKKTLHQLHQSFENIRLEYQSIGKKLSSIEKNQKKLRKQYHQMSIDIENMKKIAITTIEETQRFIKEENEIFEQTITSIEAHERAIEGNMTDIFESMHNIDHFIHEIENESETSTQMSPKNNHSHFNYRLFNKLIPNGKSIVSDNSNKQKSYILQP